MTHTCMIGFYIALMYKVKNKTHSLGGTKIMITNNNKYAYTVQYPMQFSGPPRKISN